MQTLYSLLLKSLRFSHSVEKRFSTLDEKSWGVEPGNEANLSFFFTCAADPNTPKGLAAKTKVVTVRGQQIKLKWCATCNIWRPPRASHCGLCNNCLGVFGQCLVPGLHFMGFWNGGCE